MNSSNVHVYSRQLQKKIKLDPMANVYESYNDIVKPNSNLQLVSINSTEGIKATPTTLVGNKIWEITVQEVVFDIDARFKALEDKLEKCAIIIEQQDAIIKQQAIKIEQLECRVAGLEDTVSYLAKKDVVISIAELLLFIIGVRPMNNSFCTRFDNTYDNNVNIFLENSQAANYMKKIAKISTKENISEKNLQILCNAFYKMANGLIDKRNHDVAHYKDIKKVNAEIAAMIKIFNNNKTLKTECPNEWFIISNYKLLKNAFKEYIKV